MTIAAKRGRTAPRPGGVAALREKKPLGPDQFAGVIDTPTTTSKSAKAKIVRSKASLAEGLSSADIKKLEATEKRYAEARLATTSNGRDALYD